ncbi:hypothetical protein [Oceanobacillus jordanicus]|uniref:Flagellar hook-length control protein-like C-terminal domain-containing protein n=1 Tax=Oceanobacillus jordanicus TaxID=2867266 RepID=A0AAW5B6Q4_9BACI|nr:hypothetical protein [Oceanobacillus jordanicus]MCG3419112.1 hypothetical protein [Oceanobacillus jordanicus]
MGIQKTGQSLRVLQPTPNTIKPGQVIKGSILKIYPENKAEIQLGSQKMVAQLEASLSAGGKYHFMVQSTDPVIQLKVIGEQLQQQDHLNSLNLLQQLGLKASKRNIVFLQQLIAKKIPFEKPQLTQSFHLLEGSKDKQLTGKMLVEMISNRLPITKNVLEALQSVSNSSFSGRLASAMPELDQANVQPNISQNLQKLVSNHAAISTESKLMGERINNQNLFHLLKLSGTIEPAQPFDTWRANTTTEQSGRQKDIPFQLSEAQLRNLQTVIDNRATLQQNAKLLLNSFHNLPQSIANEGNLDTQLFSRLKEQFTQSVLPYLPKNTTFPASSMLQNNRHALSQVYEFLQNAASTTTENIEVTMKQLRDVNLLMAASPKDQFLQHLKHTLSFTGYSYEHDLANKVMQEQTSLKGVLLQLMQQGDHNNNTTEQSKQLLHFINGLQLQSVQDTGNFLYASLQLPGEKLGLAKDLQLEFEGRKTEDGEIDSSHCRVLFYLDLANLNQTIIDMTVQNRNVSVTIYNQSEEELRPLAKDYQAVLKNGLNELDYHLSSVMFKPVREEELTGSKRQQSHPSSYQGVDFRI